MYLVKRLPVGNSSILVLLESCKSLKQALQIHAQIILNGFHHNIFSVSRLISTFALWGSKDGLRHSHILFSQIDKPNIFIWNTIIRGYSHSETSHQSLVLYMSLLSRGIESPNNFTFPFLLNSCARLSSLNPGFQIHCHIIKFGFELDLFIRNALIHFYSIFGYTNHARKVFDESLVRDPVSYNTMINGYAQVEQPCAALRLYREMQDFDIQPDTFTFVALFSACSVLNDPRIAKRIHALVYKNLSCVDSNMLLKTAVLDMYAKCGLMNVAERVFGTMRTSENTAAWSSMVSGYTRGGDVETARRLFDQMDQRDIVSWTAMISGYSQAGQFSEALELFGEMESLNIQPDEVTMVAILSACAGLGALDFGRRIHRQYIGNELFGRNIFVITVVIDMYAKCGSIDTALDIFYRIPKILKTVSLFNSMISGLAQHGLGKNAIDVFTEMELMRLKPDRVTFVAVLCACSHSGLVEDGKELFESMLNVYGIKPEMEHYGCMVDLLGRNGHVDKALDLILIMPYEANSIIWRALLGACRLHGNAEIGEIAGQKLLELEPNHGAYYVLLSNLLANTNQWEEARKVRKLMDDKGIQKPPGWSYIEFNGTLHRFLASEKSHPEAIEIELMLKDMTMRLKTTGYVPNTTQVVFDVDEEEKETVVSYHSEKLALAFGLINSSPEETIRIIKNLRICADCHSAFKLLSEIYKREIMVRDAIRFHHFKNGTCSCMDFW
ncbi:pentatricopeptide repeat-containing protein At2g29760, chloroplastic-like [Pistacia vera]|uniref:pentatricopeptide repeat-containing protein At2g29760, chloroplastic-like n=1 Tax=Pistacia vera TaxID=55513 RepID=UPI0012636BE5|nr:pentatricopeptide repeat-containing protein At2g29760, chloroplastic-like [Pistacia vera]